MAGMGSKVDGTSLRRCPPPAAVSAAALVSPITPRASRYQANTGPSTRA